MGARKRARQVAATGAPSYGKGAARASVPAAPRSPAAGHPRESRQLSGARRGPRGPGDAAQRKRRRTLPLNCGAGGGTGARTRSAPVCGPSGGRRFPGSWLRPRRPERARELPAAFAAVPRLLAHRAHRSRNRLRGQRGGEGADVGGSLQKVCLADRGRRHQDASRGRCGDGGRTSSMPKCPQCPRGESVSEPSRTGRPRGPSCVLSQSPSACASTAGPPGGWGRGAVSRGQSVLEAHWLPAFHRLSLDSVTSVPLAWPVT